MRSWSLASRRCQVARAFRPTKLSVAMLDAAFLENPARRIVVSAPGSIGPSLRHSLAAARARGAIVIDRALDPWVLLDRADRVYSAGGEIGFLALLAGIPVTAFAASYYSGWGATDDVAGVPASCVPPDGRRDFRRGLPGRDALPRPVPQCRHKFEEALAILADWRRLDEANRGIAVCVGMSFWKRRRIAEFVRSSAGEPQFHAIRSRAPLPRRAALRAAARRDRGLGLASAGRARRSGRARGHPADPGRGRVHPLGRAGVGLPAAGLARVRHKRHVLRPAADERPRTPAAGGGFPGAAAGAGRAARGAARHARHHEIQPRRRRQRFDLPADRRRILVPGQVEDDLSIRFGAGAVRTNLELLARSGRRTRTPTFSTSRIPTCSPATASARSPRPKRAGSPTFSCPTARRPSLLAVVDELHTMTSLAGFEALLRGRRVVVYGRPFYAGWGLTTDMSSFDRGRRLSLAQLVAGTLILYPRYLDPLTRLPCGPEIIIDRLDRPELWRPGPLVLARRLQGAAIASAARISRDAGNAAPGPEHGVRRRGLRERPRP